MDDLITWLRAQLDEDERVARAEVDLLRDYPYPEDFRVEYQWVRMARHPHGGVSTMFAPGVPSPERMLAEVDAKRRILDWCQIASLTLDAAEVYGVDPDDVLRLFALPYADRPSYQEIWRA